MAHIYGQMFDSNTKLLSLLTSLMAIFVISSGCLTYTTDKFQPNQIIYIHDEKLWAMDENGEHRQVLADCKVAHCRDNALSSNGQQFIYVGVNGKGAEITYSLGVINLDGTQKTELVSGLTGEIVDTGWSFDDSHIAFKVIYKWDERWRDEIYTAELSTKKVQRIVKGGSNFSWSPTENKIAVFGMGQGEEFGLYVMNSDGQGEQKVFVNHLIDSYDWSPDGKYFALSSRVTEKNNRLSIFLVDVDGQNLEELTVDGQYQYESTDRPQWSPNENWIAYMADYQPSGQTGGRIKFATLFITDLEHKIQKRLVDDVALTKMFWSPDGNKILYESKEDKDWYTVSVGDGTVKKVAKVADIGFTTILWWR
jgi:Tol biopolymer transport system component